MEIKYSDQDHVTDFFIDDTIDTPDCFGQFNKKRKICFGNCPIAIKCCVLKNKAPKGDLLEKLLIQNYYPIKPNQMETAKKRTLGFTQHRNIG